MNSSMVDRRNQTDSTSSRCPALSRWLEPLVSEPVLLLGFCLGTALRLYQIDLQILADDEWHALHMAIYAGVAGIVGSFGGADHCIPLALFYRVLLKTSGVSEWTMRLPVLLFGLLSLGLFPLLVRQWLGTSTARVFALLFAISPLHIYFSRYARPYGIMLFFATIAIAAFCSWWASGSKRAIWLFAGCTVAATYFHLSVILILLSPVPLAFGALLFGRRHEERSWKALLFVSVFLAAALSLLIGPPLLLDSAAILTKTSAGHPEMAAFTGALQLFSGSSNSLFLAGFLILAATGALVAIHRAGRPTGLILLLGVLQLSFLLSSRPVASEVPIVVARYSLFFLPVYLAFVSCGVSALLRSVIRGSSQFLGPFLTVALIASALGIGPLPRVYRYPNNWTNHGLYQYFYDWTNTKFSYSKVLEPAKIPDFYRQLGKFPAGSVRIVEAPWYFEWHNNNFPFSQAIHRQVTLIGFVRHGSDPVRPGELPRGDKRFHFSNFVHVGDYRTLQKRNVRFVVFHRRLAEEIPNLATREPISVEYWVYQYQARFGQPAYSDDLVVAFDVSGKFEASLHDPGKVSSNSGEGL